jgi:hypothetical protein
MTAPGLNPGRRVGKPATNRLSYGAAKLYLYQSVVIYRSSLHGARSEFHQLSLKRPNNLVLPYVSEI